MIKQTYANSANKAKKSLFFIVLAFFLVSCGGGYQHQSAWRKAGVPASVAADVASQCRYEIGVNKISNSERKQLFKDCMQGKGFRWR